MKGDIALAGFKLTAEEWQQLDPMLQAELMEVARRDDRWAISGGTTVPESDRDAAK